MDSNEEQHDKNIAQWRLLLHVFEFRIVPRTVVKHQVADALSQLTTGPSVKTIFNVDLPPLSVTSDDNVYEVEFVNIVEVDRSIADDRRSSAVQNVTWKPAQASGVHSERPITVEIIPI